jgi:hypothetical protein
MMQKPPERFFNVEDFVPGLRQVFEQPPLNPRKVILAAIPIKNPNEHRSLVPADMDRSSLTLTDGKELWCREADSLRALFRGNQQTPVLGDYRQQDRRARCRPRQRPSRRAISRQRAEQGAF